MVPINDGKLKEHGGGDGREDLDDIAAGVRILERSYPILDL